MSAVVARISRQFTDARPAKRAGLILLVLAAFSVVGTSAWAYWTTIGNGAASATTGTLNAPSAPTTSVTGPGTVHLSWSGSTLSNGTSAEGYYVTRSSGPAPTTCGTPAAPLGALTCDDTGVADGTYTYTVTAVYGSWTALGDSSTPAVTVVNDSTPPVVTVTSVNGSVQAFPYPTNATVTSFGGSCGALTGDAATVSPLLNGGATVPATAPCIGGVWTLALTTPLSTDGSRTLSATQSDTAGNSGTAPGQTVTIDKTAPLVSVTSVNGLTPTFPYVTNADVTSIGGTCGILPGDLPTVTPLIGGSATIPATAPCIGGVWTVALTTPLTSDGTLTLTATQTDTATNLGTSTANTFTIDTTPPSVTVNQKLGQADPTNALPMLWTVTFSESVTGFDAADLTRGGTATGGTVSVTGTGASYEISLSGTPTNGSTTYTIAASKALDLAGNSNTASTSTDNSITYDTVAPTVTVNQKSGQVDPTNTLPMLWTVTFSEPVTGFDATDLTRAGTTGGTAVVTGSGASYEISLSGTPANGSTTFSIASSKALDLAGNNNTASTSTDNSITYDTTPPSVTVNQKLGQADPTNVLPMLWTVTFSESVTGFDAADLTRGGTATGGTVSVTGTGASYEISLSGTPTNGSTTYTIAASKALDLVGNNNTASTSTDNSITYDTTAPTVVTMVMQDTNTNGKVDRVSVTFSEALVSSTATTPPWTLANVPSGGSLTSVSTSGAVATLTIAEGVGAADTSVGSFTVALATNAAGIRDAAGNLSSFAATAPTDAAGPVLLSIASANVGATPGKAEAGDTLTATFSEAIKASSLPGTSVVVLDTSNGNGKAVNLSMSGVSGSAFKIGLKNNYLTGNGANPATFNGSTVSQPTASTVRVTLGVWDGAGALSAGSFVSGEVGPMSPATSLTDMADNAAVGSAPPTARFF